MRLSKTGEFGLIKNIRTRCKADTPGLIAGIGDDTAVFNISGSDTLATSDMMVEGIHFDLSFTTFYQLGYKLLAVNISDIFAMGGDPEYFLVSLSIPSSVKTDHIHDLYEGISELAEKFGISIVGGDTCASRGDIVLNGTLIGTANKAITRSGAKNGDGIFVTKTVGDSAAGLMLLKKRKKKINKFSASPGMTLMKRHLMPDIMPLKPSAEINSMIDLSDGLLIDLSHICDESRVGAVIYKERLPISKELSETAKKIGIDSMELALKGGEDYALLFTAPKNIKINAFMIGEITRSERFLIDENGGKTAFKPEGFEHFK